MTSPGCRHRTTCRLCGGGGLEVVVPYPATPIADAYLASERAGEEQPVYPLDLYLCPACGHVQLCDVVDPETLFRDYTYETSVSHGLREHFRRYADEVAGQAGARQGSLVVEIGSNDGSLLRFFRQKGLKVLGVDPAREIARKASAAGVPTEPAFFDRALARRIRQRHGPAAIVAANNVFAHADNLGDMADGIRELLDRDGLFVFEVSYLPDIVEKNLFDTVYHEHLCYHSVKPLQSFFRRHGLEFVEFVRVSTKGGSFRGIVRRSDGSRPVGASVDAQVAFEAAAGYDRPDVYRRFASERDALRTEATRLLDEWKRRGMTIAGYGASATVTTLIYGLGLDRLIDFLVDDNPRKQDTVSPGAHIPVLPSSELYTKNPDCVVVLAWNYADRIMSRHAAYRDRGGRFVLPAPKVEVL